MDDDDQLDLTEDEAIALERVERAIEWFYRAHGALIEFHHAVGHAMEHLDTADGRLGGEHDVLAARLRSEVLPAGVTADGKNTYELVLEFEDGLLADVESIADATIDELAAGDRYHFDKGREP